MSTYSVQLKAEVLRSLAYTDITSSYTAIGAPFIHPIRILKVDNQTDVLCTFSLDDKNAHFVLPSGGFLLIDVTSNKLPNDSLYIKLGASVSVLTTQSPSVGAVYVSAFYSGSV